MGRKHVPLLTRFDTLLPGATARLVGRTIVYLATEGDAVRLFMLRGRHIDHTSRHDDETAALEEARARLKGRAA